MEHTINLLIAYKYFILFPLAIIEGPMITIIAGFLCSFGLLNPFIVYTIIVIADMIGDSLYYALGLYAHLKILDKINKRLGLTPRKFIKLKTYMDSNITKTITLSKVMLGIGVVGLFLAGRSKIPYSRFIKTCSLISLVQCGVYLIFGFFFGAFYKKLSDYLNYFESLTIVVVLAFFVFLIVKSKMEKK